MMDRRYVALVLAALAMAGAGCLVGDGDDAAALPPGVTEDGVTDGDRLIEAHGDALANRSYRVNVTFRIEGQGQATRRTIDQRFGADGAVHNRQLTVRGRAAQIQEIWTAADSQRLYRSRIRPSGGAVSRNVTVETLNDSSRRLGFTFVAFTRQKLADMREGKADGPLGTVERRPDATVVRITNDGIQADMRLRIAPSGLIRRVVFDDVDGDLENRWNVTTSLIEGVERPAWVDEYRQRSGA